MAQLYWSLRSHQDLADIGEFVARDSVVYAVNLIERLVAAAETLSTSPRLGRIVPEYGRDDLGEMVVRSYRVVYLLGADRVTVLRVVHAARDFRAALGTQPWLLE